MFQNVLSGTSVTKKDKKSVAVAKWDEKISYS